ncbi:MAG: aminoglycoside phosphotransferase family protein [Alphaproteobacteria bacterium]
MDEKTFEISNQDVSKALEENNLSSNAHIEQIAEGKNSVAFKCGELIVRVPKQERAFECYEKEDKFSKLIRDNNFGYFDKKIPMVDAVHGSSFNFAVHKEIEGKTFKKNTPVGDDNTHLDQLSELQQNKLATELGEFLANLHKVPLDNLEDETPEEQTYQLSYKADMSHQARNKEIMAKYEINYEMMNTNKEDIVLCHNDLHGGNIAINPENESVLGGVFDLGEMGKNSREKDFMSLYSGTDRRFMRNLVESYNQHSDKQISMKELDHYYMNKMVSILDYMQENNPEKIGLVEKELGNFKSDLVTEKIGTLRDRIKSHNVKEPYKSNNDLSKIDFNTLIYAQNKKQNG